MIREQKPDLGQLMDRSPTPEYPGIFQDKFEKHLY
jgi:hypothetical protein